MHKWRCQVCGYVYDPASGDDECSIPPDTPFEALPKDWVCPECGATKANYRKLD